MRTLRSLVIVLVALAGAAGLHAQQGIPGSGLAGHWQGALKATPVIELRLALEVTNTNGTLAAVMISIDQGGARVPVTAISESQGAVQFETRAIGGSFAGRLSADGSEIAGEWQQGGNKLPLVFKRLAGPPSLSRAQDPTPPYPYDVEDVTFENPTAKIALAGTLTRPRGTGPHPVVVLISGSGPQDRDEAIMGHRPFLVLADHLTRQGVAVLRYDDRGVGRSAGNFRMATHHDFASDTRAAVNWLKTRKDIDGARIGLVGHSEGAVAAPLVAVAQPRDIAFLVLLAGPGVPMAQLLERQGRDMARVMGLSAEEIETNVASQRAVFDLLREKLDAPTLESRLRDLSRKQLAALTPEQRKAYGYTEAMMENQIQTVLTPWFRELLTYDPRVTLRQVTCPVLALNGEKDVQVASADNLSSIREAVMSGGNAQITTREFPGLNHLFQTATTGAVTEYGRIEETFSPVALGAISEWIRQRVGLN